VYDLASGRGAGVVSTLYDPATMDCLETTQLPRLGYLDVEP
jgi:hypothetical protein